MDDYSSTGGMQVACDHCAEASSAASDEGDPVVQYVGVVHAWFLRKVSASRM
mgnify:CR=1 FL=1